MWSQHHKHTKNVNINLKTSKQQNLVTLKRMKIIDTTLHIKRHILDVFSGDVSGIVQTIFLISAYFCWYNTKSLMTEQYLYCLMKNNLRNIPHKNGYLLPSFKQNKEFRWNNVHLATCINRYETHMDMNTPTNRWNKTRTTPDIEHIPNIRRTS